MTQTFKRVKDSLLALLQDKDHRVIALTGKWGTGKTYLWQSVAIEQFGKNKASEQPIYVSLFGVRTINDLKLRILQSTYLKDASTVQALMKTGGGILTGVINKLAGFSAENAALIWLPQLTKGRLIVIDDIERKHNSLDIDEFLGMLDEYSETHDTRFLILLNTDKLLENTGMWATLHEKVIDAEIVLDPAVIETFDIAAKGSAAPYLNVARDAVVILNINNIRVIKRVLKMMERIADATKNIDGVSAARWVPSTALLTAGHYRAIENAPPFEYMKSLNRFSHFLDDQKGIKRDPKELDWDLLLNKLDIQVIDAYEEILQQFLKSGLLDNERLKILFEGYKKEGVHADAFAKQNEFFKACWWDANRSDGDLLAMARELLPYINVYGPDSITDIVSVIEKLGDVVLARQFLDSWLLSIETRPEYKKMEEVPFDTSLRQYHPDVIKKMNEMRDEQHPPLNVIEIVERITNNSSWGERERYSLRNSTIQQYEDALKQLTGDQLRRFLYKNLEWAKNPLGDENFKIGADNFLAACFNVYSEASKSRLSKIIYRTFEANGLSAKLETPLTDSSPLM